MSQSSDTLMSIVNSILDLTKIESGHIEISKDQVDIEKLVESVIQSFSTSVLAKKFKD